MAGDINPIAVNHRTANNRVQLRQRRHLRRPTAQTVIPNGRAIDCVKGRDFARIKTGHDHLVRHGRAGRGQNTGLLGNRQELPRPTAIGG